MRIVLDTNVFVSGIFFGGSPGTVIDAWQAEQIQLVLSLEILQEYERVGTELTAKYPGVDLAPILQYLTVHAEFCDPLPLETQVCEDADDDKFLACAIAAGADYVVTGDKLLLKVTGYGGVEILRPRDFVDRYLAH